MEVIIHENYVKTYDDGNESLLKLLRELTPEDWEYLFTNGFKETPTTDFDRVIIGTADFLGKGIHFQKLYYEREYRWLSEPFKKVYRTEKSCGLGQLIAAYCYRDDATKFIQSEANLEVWAEFFLKKLGEGILKKIGVQYKLTSLNAEKESLKGALKSLAIQEEDYQKRIEELEQAKSAARRSIERTENELKRVEQELFAAKQEESSC